ncbi:hypothetical protein FRC00_010775 [Tulasnella sp. 408]|nr:hypothetical protein FRC00_010775 [Tulasnella sp. 408]
MQQEIPDQELQQVSDHNMQDDGDVNYYQDGGDYENTEELSLEMLKDSPPGQKPMYPFSTLIRCAIKGSPTGKLLLEDIYYCLEKRFEYFRNVPPGWKNTIRHTLSLHPSFEKVPRPLTDRGKGCYWTINEVVDPRIGVQRVRKKKNGMVTPGRKPGRGRPSVPVSGPSGAGPVSPDQQAWFDPATGMPRPPAVPIPFYTGFDPQGNPYPIQVPPQYQLFLAEDAYEPEFGSDGQPDWHAIWKNELRRLRHATIEQMRAGAPQDWYKHMVETVRTAFMLPVAPDGAAPPPPGDVPNEPVDGVGMVDPGVVDPTMEGQAAVQVDQSHE